VHFTRARDLLIAGLVGLVGGYLLFDLFYRSMPSIPLLAGVTLLALAAGETAYAFNLRAKLRDGLPVNGLLVARVVALAKASSMLGAIMAGGWLGALAYLAPEAGRRDIAADDVVSASVSVVFAAALVAATAIARCACCAFRA
jgi:hypothetical protein